jgi:hypothetical protein
MDHEVEQMDDEREFFLVGEQSGFDHLEQGLHQVQVAGLGGNVALMDARQLSSELSEYIEGNKPLIKALRDFEVSTITRTMQDVRASSRSGVNIFNQKPLPNEDVDILD